jgi:hypothetical protein
MWFVGLVVLALVLIASAKLVAPHYTMKGAEGILAMLLVAIGMVSLTAHALSWVASFRVLWIVLLLVAMSFAALGRSPRRGLKDGITALADIRAALYRLIALCKDSGWLALLTGAAGAVTLYSAVATWLLPSSSWDGQTYHDPLAFFTIQNRGFAIVPNVYNVINGYPRVSETLSAVVVLFSSATFIELPNTLLLPIFALSIYVAAKRCMQAPLALALALSAFFVPSVVLQLRTTYNDGILGLFVVACAHFATRKSFLLLDALLCALCAGLALGTKGSAVYMTPPFVAIALFRLVRAKAPAWSKLLVVILGSALIFAFAGPFFLRNYQRFANPLYPVPIHVDALHIHWLGTQNDVTDINRPMADVAKVIWGTDTLTDGSTDPRRQGYGLIVPWLLVPAAAIYSLRAILTLIRKPHAWRTALPLLTWVLLLAMLKASPAIWWARYNLAQVAALAILTGGLVAFSSKSMSRSLAHGFIAAATVLSLLNASLFDHCGAGGVQQLWETWAHRRDPLYKPYAPPVQAPPVFRQWQKQYQAKGDCTTTYEAVQFVSVLFAEHGQNQVFSGTPTSDAFAEARKRGCKLVVTQGASPSDFRALGPVFEGGSWVAFVRRTTP